MVLDRTANLAAITLLGCMCIAFAGCAPDGPERSVGVDDNSNRCFNETYSGIALYKQLDLVGYYSELEEAAKDVEVDKELQAKARMLLQARKYKDILAEMKKSPQDRTNWIRALVGILEGYDPSDYSSVKHFFFNEDEDVKFLNKEENGFEDKVVQYRLLSIALSHKCGAARSTALEVLIGRTKEPRLIPVFIAALKDRSQLALEDGHKGGLPFLYMSPSFIAFFVLGKALFYGEPLLDPEAKKMEEFFHSIYDYEGEMRKLLGDKHQGREGGDDIANFPGDFEGWEKESNLYAEWLGNRGDEKAAVNCKKYLAPGIYLGDAKSDKVYEKVAQWWKMHGKDVFYFDGIIDGTKKFCYLSGLYDSGVDVELWWLMEPETRKDWSKLSAERKELELYRTRRMLDSIKELTKENGDKDNATPSEPKPSE